MTRFCGFGRSRGEQKNRGYIDKISLLLVVTVNEAGK
jgi:hypothetical protein